MGRNEKDRGHNQRQQHEKERETHGRYGAAGFTGASSPAQHDLPDVVKGGELDKGGELGHPDPDNDRPAGDSNATGRAGQRRVQPRK